MMRVLFMHAENKHYVKLLIWILSLILMGSGIGFLTKNTIDTWYITLNRSALTPPNYVFGIAWNILYVMIAVSGWLLWESKPFLALQQIKILYVLQLILNWIWTPLFFSYHLTGLACICLTMMVILLAILIVKAYKNLTAASLLLVPYLLWLLFASYLNFYIWQYN